VLSPHDAVGLALDTARAGLANSEMPIGAIVFDDERILGSSYTKEHALRRRIVHADLLAMLEADKRLGFANPTGELTLAVNLEPCMMCMGAAITLGVRRVWYALESPNDGAADVLSHWSPPEVLPFFTKPAEVVAGIRRAEAQELFHQYAHGDGPAGMRAWARSLT